MDRGWVEMKIRSRIILWTVSTLLVGTIFSVAGIGPVDVTAFWAAVIGKDAAPAAEAPPPRALGTPASPSQAKILIRSLGVISPIVFPTSTDLEALRQALDQGVVHYPLAAFPHEARGNVFLFGHSSARPFEKNPARTTFTRLGELEPGQEVEIWYRERAYTYRVRAVKILKPWEAEVYFATEKRMLTLSTCWPIGDPRNRFVVEAEFMRSSPLPSSVSAAGTSS